MKPDQHFDKPGKSPFMDMQLVAKCAGGEAAGAGGVNIDPTLVQNFGVRTAQAEIGVLEPETNVTGTLAYNAREVAIVQPRASGFVQRTYRSEEHTSELQSLMRNPYAVFRLNKTDLRQINEPPTRRLKNLRRQQ